MSGDPNGLAPIALSAGGGSHLASNDATVFSVLSTAEGKVRSYKFDLKNPVQSAVLIDEFAIPEASATTRPPASAGKPAAPPEPIAGSQVPVSRPPVSSPAPPVATAETSGMPAVSAGSSASPQTRNRGGPSLSDESLQPSNAFANQRARGTSNHTVAGTVADTGAAALGNTTQPIKLPSARPSTNLRLRGNDEDPK
eukprot:NODE_2884_length_1097_cov_22.680344_g2645_i0.p1 GENE.NODE_2884_length_1097_cov_22.680344_g2645_i0~~NODE_2884_length_1097_cov_22.680344_g2645_i0.p1  ORF type:complete len:197 (+),score=27.37 NODE_2884_length_1097_cov_22.680344_g2645_i0:306-896(+)